MLKKSLFFKIMIHFLLPALKKAKSIIDKMNAIIKCYYSIFHINSHRMLWIKSSIFFIYVSFSFIFFGLQYSNHGYVCSASQKINTYVHFILNIFPFRFFFKLHMYVYCKLIFINVLENCTMFNYFFTN